VSIKKELVSFNETCEFVEAVAYGQPIEAQICCENAVAGPEERHALQRCFGENALSNPAER
jgi:hypothetical protein